MRDYMNIGCSPASEDCAQVGAEDYYPRAVNECKALIGQLRRELGEEPFGARLRVEAFPHDFGTYHEVVCEYNEEYEDAEEYAFRCESELPDRWDAEARKELGLEVVL